MLYAVVVEFSVTHYATGKRVRRTRTVETFATDGIEAMDKVARMGYAVVTFFTP